MSSKKAIILLSGGIDSATTAAIAIQENFEIYCLTINYSQRHSHEIAASKEVAKSLSVNEHKIIDLNLRTFGGSALTSNEPVPKDREPEVKDEKIPITYVPARNTIFLSLAAAWAEVLEAFDIFIGVTAVNYSGYPDCRESFIKSFEETINLGTRAGIEGVNKIKIQTPLINISKKDIILLGNRLGIDYSLTLSCYDPDENARACGCCDSCKIRREAFDQANLQDPTVYISD